MQNLDYLLIIKNILNNKSYNTKPIKNISKGVIDYIIKYFRNEELIQ